MHAIDFWYYTFYDQKSPNVVRYIFSSSVLNSKTSIKTLSEYGFWGKMRDSYS